METTQPIGLTRVADCNADEDPRIEARTYNMRIGQIKKLLRFLKSKLEEVSSEPETVRSTGVQISLARYRDAALEAESFLNELCDELDKPFEPSRSAYKTQMLLELEEHVYSNVNRLLLYKNLRHTTEEYYQSFAEVEVVKAGLDHLAKEIVDFSDRIFPPVRKENGQQETFVVNELPLASMVVPRAPGHEQLVCTKAHLGDYSSLKGNIFEFQCICNGTPHEEDLKYKIIQGKSFLQEEVGNDGLRKWCILVSKPYTSDVYTLRLSRVSPAQIKNIQALSTKIAAAYLGNHASSLKAPVKFPAGRSREHRAVEIAHGDWGFPSSKIVQVTYESAGIVYLLTERPSVKLKHSGIILLPSERSGFGGGILEHLVPLPHFSIIIQDPCLRGNGEVRVTTGTEICHETNPLGRLIVTLQQTSIATAETQHGHKEDYSVHFHFDDKKDAEIFSSYLRASQDILQAQSMQFLSNSETVVYLRDFPTITHNSSLRFGIVSSQKQYRVIAYRSRNAGALDFSLNNINEGVGSARADWVRPLDITNFWDQLTSPGLANVALQKKPSTTESSSSGTTELKPLPRATFIKSDHERTANDWLDEVDNLIRVLKGDKAEAYDNVKIAIIDSGLHDTERGHYEVEYIDFTTDTSNDSWHGTCCAGIIRDIYEDASLYIARVFERDHADEVEGPLRMARAIHWAIEPPCSVDIISISAGFRHYSKELDDAVTKAKAAGVLVMAAASNWQNTSSVAFPARHNLSTMCIYSTNTGNQPSTFNPEPRVDTPNFAILGEGFQHPDQKRNESMSGTSMATAVAAGLAARIVDFLRQSDNKAAIFRAQDVGKLPGMLSIFSAMSKPAGNLKYVSPLELLPLRHGVSREADRQRVRERLSQAMERAN